MSLAALLQKGSLRAVATLTVATTATVEPKNTPSVAKVAIVNVASAENFELDSTATVDVDRWCYPLSQAANGTEIERMAERLAHFAEIGLTVDTAERLADKLLQRDRDASDDRVVCLECKHLQRRPELWRCGHWLAARVAIRSGDALLPTDLVLQMQRCGGFTPYLTSTPQGKNDDHAQH